MKIVDLICAKGRTGFYFDDQRAIKNNAQAEGATYKGIPLTPGFSAVRQAGEAVSVILVLEDGQLAYGDCAAVQYSGAGGRDPLFLAEEFIPVIDDVVKPKIVGQELKSFKLLSQEIDQIIDPSTGLLLHTAIRYGISQAILDAVAKANHQLMCEVISDEYAMPLIQQAIPIFCQSGDNRYDNVDKMIIKQADVLPHGLINHVSTKLGEKGELLLAYVKWLKQRIMQLRVQENYNPILHIDVYGTIGAAFAMNNQLMVAYLKELAEAVAPLKLRIEGPMDAEGRKEQMEALKELTTSIDAAKIDVQLVADEWCNTLEDIKYFADNRAGHMIQIKTPDLGAIHNVIEAVLYCKDKGVGAYLGGTCNETDRSAQVCTHIALATQPDQMLAKPGMGVDEGYMIVYNEMQRVLAILKHKRSE